MSPPSKQFDPPKLPFPRRVLVATAIVAALLLLFVFVWYAVYVLLLAFAGVLVAILLNGMADGVGKVTGLSYGWSLAITMVLLLLVLVGGGWLMAPPIASQVEQLAEQIPQSLESLVQRLERYRVGQWILDNMPEQGELRPTSPEAIARATGFVSTTIGAFFSLIVVLFVGGYAAVNPTLYTNGLLRLVPLVHRPRGAEVLAAIGYTLRWWLIGQLMTMTAVGTMTAIGLWLLGVPLALSLGLLAFLLDFIPNFGPIIAAAPAVLLALAEDPTKAVWVTLLYVVVQQIESLLISPLVHQKTVHIPPALTILAQVLLGVTVGPLGLLLATPLAAVGMVLTKMLYIEETLGDEVDTPDDHLSTADEPPVPVPEQSPPAGAQKQGNEKASEVAKQQDEPSGARDRRAPPAKARRRDKK